MKTFKLTIIVQTSNNFDEGEFTLCDDDVVDGFTLTRDGDDITEKFKLKSAYIQDIQKL